jgi:hypothetical protein
MDDKKHGSSGIKLTARSARHALRNTSRKTPVLSVKEVVAAFNGRPLPMKVGNTEAPITLLAIRGALMEQLRSTGGRPSLSGEHSRQRVQVSPEDWQRITSIANHVDVGRHKPSPAQVASVLLHFALENISAKDISRLMAADAGEHDSHSAQ